MSIWRRLIALIVGCAAAVAFACASLAAEAITKPSKITLDENGVLVVDGRKVFPINLTVGRGPVDAEVLRQRGRFDRGAAQELCGIGGIARDEAHLRPD
jgi:hypothetical protein